MQFHVVKPVTATNDMLRRAKVHHGVTADLNERVAAKPKHQLTQGIICRKLLKHGMYPGPATPAQYGHDLPTVHHPVFATLTARDLPQPVDVISVTLTRR